MTNKKEGNREIQNNDELDICAKWTIIIFVSFIAIPLIFGIINAINESNIDGVSIVYGITLIAILIIAFIFNSKIKNLVLKVGRWLLDFNTTLDVLAGIIILVVGAFISYELSINYWWFVLGAFIYSLLALVKDYVLYLLVDIRDSLKILAENNNSNTKIENKNI